MWLNNVLKMESIIAISGASTVPGLSAAVIDHFLRDEFSEIHEIESCITPGNQTPRGLATMQSVLSYCGTNYKSLEDGKMVDIIGWQGIERVTLPEVGERIVLNCEIPDLELFPEMYPTLKTNRFKAGLELNVFNYALYLMSHVTQLGIYKNWAALAPLLKPMSEMLYRFGSKLGGMQMTLKGLDRHGKSKTITWNIIADKGVSFALYQLL